MHKKISIVSSAAIDKAGKMMQSEANLARRMNTAKQNLNNWKLYRAIPYDKAVAIHVITKGQVSVNELRPDLAGLTEKFKSLLMEKYKKFKSAK